MSTTAKPLKVYGGDSWQPTSQERETVLAWMRSQGLDPTRIFRMDVYGGEQPYAHVVEHKLNADGRRYCDVDHNHEAELHRCSAALRTCDHPLSSLPPEEPKARLSNDTKEAIARIPGDEGWWRTSGQETYEELAADLIAKGLAPGDAVSVLESAYAAAAGEFGE